MMDGDKLEEKKIGTVKAAISSYRERMVEGNNHHTTTNKKFQPNYPEKSYNRTRELHHAKMDTNKFNETKSLAESAKSEAESKLSDAKKIVKDLTRKIEASNSRARDQTMYLEKLKMAKRKEVVIESNSSEDSHSAKVLRDLEWIKQQMSKLKLDISSVSEKKRISEQDSESYMTKATSYLNSFEMLSMEIEDIHEEHVLVELARLEAIKEFKEVEFERREEGEKYSSLLEEAEKKRQNMIREIENSKVMEEKLAITTSDIDLLQNELNQVKEINNGEERDDKYRKLELVTMELEAATKEYDSIKEESFQFMASMDVVRNELCHVIEEASKYKEKEEKTDMIIQNLNSKLLRAKDKLEAISEAADKAKSMESDLSRIFQQLQSESKAPNNERSLLIEETAITKAEIRKTETDIDLYDEKLEAAIQEIKAVKSSETAALDNLKALIERTMRNRGSTSKASSTITISKFEYDYLTGNAGTANVIADKKVEAAKAWVEALNASEKEIVMKTELLRRESREIRVEKGGKKITIDDQEREFEKWMSKMESDHGSNNNSRSSHVRKKVVGRKSTSSPVVVNGVGGTNRLSTSFNVGRRRKMMPSLGKLLSGRT